VFPWVAADANGHVAIACTAPIKSQFEHVPLTTQWNVYVAEASTVTLSRRFHAEPSTDHVNHTGGSQPAASLQLDRSLADFFQIAIDPTNHKINIATRITCGTSVTYFTRQKQATVASSPAVHAEVTKKTGGDEPGKNGALPTSVSITTIAIKSRTPKTSAIPVQDGFPSTKVTSATFNSVAHSVTISGLGTTTDRRSRSRSSLWIAPWAARIVQHHAEQRLQQQRASTRRSISLY